MASAEGSPDLHRRHITAIDQFDRELDAVIGPASDEGLRWTTKKLLISMFDYSPKEAETRIAMLEESGNFPTETDLELDPEAGPELLKTCLFDELAEDYFLRFGQEAFDQWIEPYLRSVLHGHLSDSLSDVHKYDCLEDPTYRNPGPFCSAVVMRRMVRNELCEGGLPTEKSVGYITHPEEMVYINVSIIKTLQKLGIYNEKGVEKLLDKYMDWLESEHEPLSYDAELFD